MRLPSGIAIGLAVAGLAACSTPGSDPRYRPTENVLEAVALLRLHVDDDTYRFPPARDFTGKNVYVASLRRLEDLERANVGALRGGTLTDVIWFGEARALERIGEYELASLHYRRVAELDSPLREPALQGRHVTEQLRDARAIQPGPELGIDEALARFDERERLLAALAREVDGTHYEYVIQEERERADRERALWMRARRRMRSGLDALALQQYQRLVRRNRESKNRNRNLLDLGDLYAEMARDYAWRFPPVSLEFDAATFREYATGASRLYEAVSQQDGAIEKIEAARKLEAFLSFQFQVTDEHLPHR
ncbi:MAG: hypothetical protein ACE5IL_04850 [Myxococcota bacterium]